jgi:hypothetical protein
MPAGLAASIIKIDRLLRFCIERVNRGRHSIERVRVELSVPEISTVSAEAVWGKNEFFCVAA